MSSSVLSASHRAANHNIKAIVRGLLDELPDDCTLEDVMLALYVRACIVESREQIAVGGGSTLEAARKELDAWFQSQSPASSPHD